MARTVASRQNASAQSRSSTVVDRRTLRRRIHASTGRLAATEPIATSGPPPGQALPRQSASAQRRSSRAVDRRTGFEAAASITTGRPWAMETSQVNDRPDVDGSEAAASTSMVMDASDLRFQRLRRLRETIKRRQRHLKTAFYYDTGLIALGGLVRTFLSEDGGLHEFWMVGSKIDFDSMHVLGQYGRFFVFGKFKLVYQEWNSSGDDIKGWVISGHPVAESFDGDAMDAVNNSAFGVRYWGDNWRSPEITDE